MSFRAEARAPGGVRYDTITYTLRLDATVPDDRRVTFTLPEEVPVGEAQFVLTVEPKRERPQGVDAELWTRMLQQEAAGIITIPAELRGAWRLPSHRGDRRRLRGNGRGDHRRA